MKARRILSPVRAARRQAKAAGGVRASVRGDPEWTLKDRRRIGGAKQPRIDLRQMSCALAP
jgi:hypothetical protein